MEITRQLRKDKLTKKGFAPIQLTISWDGHRVRASTGQRIQPEHWDYEGGRVIVRAGTNYATINPILNRFTDAAESAQNTAQKEQRRLPKHELLAAIEQVAKPVSNPTPVTVNPSPAGFTDLMTRWIIEHSHKARSGTGRPLSPVAVAGLHATLARYQHFSKSKGQELRLDGFDMEFYQSFRVYVIDELHQSINTFGKHIDRLKTFLTWCEDELDLPVHRHFRKFVAPRERGRVDALSQDELHCIANLDFQDSATRLRLQELRSKVRQMDNKREDWSAERWIEHVDLARDKFLQCCYTGLRISDANRLTWRNVHGQMIVLDDTAKTGITCYIPFYDDEHFKPVALANRYESRSELDLLVPECYRANEFLRVVQQLIGLTRLKLTTKIGRKTSVTLKLYQGVPSRLIMQATGHQTEEVFNH